MDNLYDSTWIAGEDCDEEEFEDEDYDPDSNEEESEDSNDSDDNDDDNDDNIYDEMDPNEIAALAEPTTLQDNEDSEESVMNSCSRMKNQTRRRFWWGVWRRLGCQSNY